jgi:hypothetical protein
MADSKRSKKNRHPASDQPKKHRTADQERRERRFLPEQTRSSLAYVVVGWLGSVALGAGAWARWVSEPSHAAAIYMLAAGAVAVAVSLWWIGAGSPVRVGDAGLAIERGSEITRLLWCDMKRIRVDAGRLLVEGRERTLALPMDIHRRAVAWVLSEAARRVPEVLDVKRKVVSELPKPEASDGQLLTVTDLQVAGRHCRASGTVIAFERDARLCAGCGQVYHRAHVPDTCTSCQKDLGSRALRAHPD